MKTTAKLSLKTQGVKVQSPKWTEKLGYAAIFCNDNGQSQENCIIVDSYSGSGPTYQPREKNLINIDKNGITVFSGDFDKLIEAIRPTPKVLNLEVANCRGKKPVLTDLKNIQKKLSELLIELNNNDAKIGLQKASDFIYNVIKSNT